MTQDNVINLADIRKQRTYDTFRARIDCSAHGMVELSDNIQYAINCAMTRGTVDMQGAMLTLLAMTGKLIAHYDPQLEKPLAREVLLSMLDRFTDQCLIELWEKNGVP